MQSQDRPYSSEQLASSIIESAEQELDEEGELEQINDSPQPEEESIDPPSSKRLKLSYNDA